jgi:hypothetical protein
LKKRKHTIEQLSSTQLTPNKVDGGEEVIVSANRTVDGFQQAPKRLKVNHIEPISPPQSYLDSSYMLIERLALKLPGILTEVLKSSRLAWKNPLHFSVNRTPTTSKSTCSALSLKGQSPLAISRRYQDIGDFLFCLGLHEDSHDAYTKFWSWFLESKVSMEEETIALVACLRSATTEAQLKKFVGSTAHLQIIYGSITTGISSGLQAQEGFEYEYSHLVFQLVYETWNRICLSTSHGLWTEVQFSVTKQSWQMEIATMSPRVNLIWDSLAQKMIPDLHSGVSLCLPDLQNPVRAFLRTPGGHMLFLTCLGWCDETIQSRLAETCMDIVQLKQDAFWIYEVAMYCFLWRGWKFGTSHVYSATLDNNEISAPHLFRAIAKLIADKASSDKKKAVRDDQFKTMSLTAHLKRATESLRLLSREDIGEMALHKFRVVLRGPGEESSH